MTKWKYGSTQYHYLTPGRDPNDKVMDTNSNFVGKEVVITEKLNGENSSGYSDGSTHARSIDSRYHWTRAWFKKFWAERYWNLPEGWVIRGENLYGCHSIPYDDLDTFFYGFSIWDENKYCLSWIDTLVWFDIIGIKPVPVLYVGPYSDEIVKQTWDQLDTNKQEGLVIRLSSGYNYDQFEQSLCKLVRQNHIATDEHWSKNCVPNKLKDKNESNSIS